MLLFNRLNWPRFPSVINLRSEEKTETFTLFDLTVKPKFNAHNSRVAGAGRVLLLEKDKRRGRPKAAIRNRTTRSVFPTACLPCPQSSNMGIALIYAHLAGQTHCDKVNHSRAIGALPEMEK